MFVGEVCVKCTCRDDIVVQRADLFGLLCIFSLSLRSSFEANAVAKASAVSWVELPPVVTGTVAAVTVLNGLHLARNFATASVWEVTVIGTTSIIGAPGMIEKMSCLLERCVSSAPAEMTLLYKVPIASVFSAHATAD